LVLARLRTEAGDDSDGWLLTAGTRMPNYEGTDRGEAGIVPSQFRAGESQLSASIMSAAITFFFTSMAGPIPSVWLLFASATMTCPSAYARVSNAAQGDASGWRC
jgi:hypothetical protein